MSHIPVNIFAHFRYTFVFLVNILLNSSIYMKSPQIFVAQ